MSQNYPCFRWCVIDIFLATPITTEVISWRTNKVHKWYLAISDFLSICSPYEDSSKNIRILYMPIILILEKELG